VLAVGAATFSVVELDPRPAPNEREIVVALSTNASSPGLSTNASSPGFWATLAIGLAAAVVDATAASERGVAGAITMRAATIAVSTAVASDMIE
jgi:hypothetical protein